MSTPNFHYNNILYAVELENEWDYDDLKSGLSYELEQQKNFTRDEQYEDGLRGYPGFSIGYLSEFVEFNSYYDGKKVPDEIRLECLIIIRSGYYTGCNVDIDFKFCHDGEDYEVLEDLFDNWYYTRKGNKYFDGYSIAQSVRDKVEQEFEFACDRLKEQAIEIIKHHAHRLTCTAVFSNGEAMYKWTDRLIK